MSNTLVEGTGSSSCPSSFCDYCSICQSENISTWVRVVELDIDDPYVDVDSLTYGHSRQHIWTFAADIKRILHFVHLGYQQPTMGWDGV